MVEGHGIHRVANSHRKVLIGKIFNAISPNKKFTEGARTINNKELIKIEAHGKNLFYFFGKEESTTHKHIVRVHFGMSGRFKVHGKEVPDPTINTRLRIISGSTVADLSAMICELFNFEEYRLFVTINLGASLNWKDAIFGRR